jgi:hypothetical protein
VSDPRSDAARDETIRLGEALEISARAFGQHSGPESTPHERNLFGQDLRSAALRFARAYYAEARTLGLIPEHKAGRTTNLDNRSAVTDDD